MVRWRAQARRGNIRSMELIVACEEAGIPVTVPKPHTSNADLSQWLFRNPGGKPTASGFSHSLPSLQTLLTVVRLRSLRC